MLQKYVKTSLMILSLLFLFFVINTHIAFAAQTTKMQWNAVINMLPMQINEMRAMPVTKGIDLKISTGKIELKGYQSIDELRSTLFGNATAERINFLGGPIELTITLPSQSLPVTLKLQSRTTTGYGWKLDTQNSDYTLKEPISFKKRQPGVGVPAIETIKLKANGSNSGKVRLMYQRSFEKDTPIRTKMNLNITDTNGIIELTDPTPIKPLQDNNPNHTEMAPAIVPQVKTLPAAYDSRTLGIIPSVRDQGSCGSCWAFGTVGVMEIAIAKSGGSIQDLSEQFLLSCNNDDWNCDGGLTASKYHYNTLGIAQNAVGAVLESAKPYIENNGSCPSAYPHPYVGSSWQFLTGSEWTMPTNDQIKNAILTYGAVTAGVCTDYGWDNYTGGVYTPSSNNCSDSTDHQIVLVGWNDATQSWILRNSWGTNWGENGYMRISYDPSGTTSRVGEGTSYIAVATSSYTINPGVLAAINSLLLDSEQFTVTPTAGAGGSISPNTPQTLDEGMTQAFTVTPNSGYTRNPVVGGTCPQGSWNGNVWTTGAIVTNCTVTFSFTASVPIATTGASTNITQTSAKLNGTVISAGAIATVSFNFGTTNAYGTNVTAAPAQVHSNTAVAVTATKTGLTCGTTYYYRTKAVNSAGTSYGLGKTFATAACPDLVITNAALTPVSPGANGTFTATITVKNQGAGAGDGKFLDVWNHQPTGQICGAVGNKRLAVGMLAAGASKILTFTGLPAGIAGMKMLRAFVDSGCGTKETNEGNNQRIVIYPVNQATGVDFVVTSVTLNPTAPAANGTFTATVTVKNQGTLAGDGKFLDTWSHQPTAQVCGAVGNKRLAVGILAAGASKILTFTGLPAGITGAKTFRAFVDSGCGTAENNEGNNQMIKSYMVQ